MAKGTKKRVKPELRHEVGVLDDRMKKFINNYLSNGGSVPKASESVGVSKTTGYKWINAPEVQRYIQSVTDALPDIARREDLQRFWTDTLADKTVSMGDRVRCSELLAKSQAVFTENVNVNKRDVNQKLEEASDELLDKIARGEISASELVGGDE